ncbi:unnamed protein product [Orchesella dallaii]|uniref:Uncharacterized protein n=1 Tax=Orchesella dallaii TaxID=48710 RepID=A0ABP1S4V1_9HEXA
MDWNTAKQTCTQEKIFRMATLEKLSTFTYVARLLEEWVNQQKVQDTWYWLDATFNEKDEVYMWNGDPKRALTFSNFFYRYPRPTGIGSQVTWRNMYDIQSNVSQCLSIALPYPGLATPGSAIFGHSTTFDERPCVSSQKRHAICEYVSECGASSTDPFTLTEDKDQYFADGNWIIGNRRYVVNWKQRSQKESYEFCRNNGLKLIDPNLNEQCLIPHLKMWSRAVTISQFWTNWTYKIDSGIVGKFYDAVGTEKATWRAFSNTSGMPEYQELEINGRSNKFDKTFCVTLQHSYEFKNTQLPCPDGQLSACNWNFIQYVPSNCNNYQGTICQHTDNVNRFKMARHNSTRWYSSSKQTSGSAYIYDYLETYWVVDDEGFNKDMHSQCAISEPEGEGKTRKIRKVSCTEWHFYICEQRIKNAKLSTIQLKYQIPQANGWNEQRHARVYPIL